MNVRTAIIGGTGVSDKLAALGGSTVKVPTREGVLSGRLIGDLFVVFRHSAGHKVPPHLVNYKAIALGLGELGVKTCLSTAAVGCMRRDWEVGTMIAVSDFVDLTGRNQTLFDRSVVHTDFTHVTSDTLREHLIDAAYALGLPLQPKGVYVCGNGPRYESPYEIELYGKFGDVVGMTAATEATLIHEAGIDYACLAIVTNAAAGQSETVLSHKDVERQMNVSGEDAVRLLLETAKRLGS